MPTKPNVPIRYPDKIHHEKLGLRPKRPPFWANALLRVVVPILLIGKKIDFQKEGMDKLGEKEPYILLYNHSQFADIPILLRAALPMKMNNIATIDAFHGPVGLLNKLGHSIPARKFGQNLTILRNIRHVLEANRAILGMTPEAQYSNDGLSGPIPESVGKMIKAVGAPVVTLAMHGNYANNPNWGDGHARNEIALKATMSYALSPEDLAALSATEITSAIRSRLQFNDWQYWREGGFRVTYAKRAEGIENIFYKCPECGAEFRIASHLARFSCEACECEWELTETGTITGANHEAKFAYPDDWLSWEREKVRQEIIGGTYLYEETAEAFTAPNKDGFVHVGPIKVRHTREGFTIDGHYNGADFHFSFGPANACNIQAETKFDFIDHKSALALSTTDDTIHWEPSAVGMLYKVELAVEELYTMARSGRLPS